MTWERKHSLTGLDAKIILSKGSKGMNDAQDLAEEIVAKNPDKYFLPNQLNNKYNVLPHYETTGEEIWRDAEGKITHFVAGIETSGTTVGVSKKLREYKKDVRITATPIHGLKNLQTRVGRNTVLFALTLMEKLYWGKKINLSM